MNIQDSKDVFKSKNSVKKFARSYIHDKQKWREIIWKAIEEDPKLLFFHASLSGFFSSQERQEIMRKFMESKPENCLPYLEEISNIIPDEKIRKTIFELYNTSPWNVQIHREKLKTILPTSFFETKIDDEFDEKLFSLFLLMHGHNELDAFSEKMKKFLQEKTDEKNQISANIFEPREVGFLCGQAEENFRQAIWKDRVCVVNDNFLAKFYHPSTPQSEWKVSYVPLDTYHSDNWYVVWGNYFYAPTERQHQEIIDAIEAGEKKLILPNLAIKPVRPMNELTSEQVRNTLIKKWYL